MSLYAQCPVCPRVFRPRSMDPKACWESVKVHVKALAHGCQHHRTFKQQVFDNPNRAACPVCQSVFESATEACIHMCAAPDEAHLAFREQAMGSMPALARERESGIPFRQRMQNSALYSAAKSGRSEEVKTYLDNGAEPDSVGEDGFTPLMTASEGGHEKVVEILLGHNECNINARNRYGQTALCLAAINGRVETTLILLQREDVVVESVGGGLTIAQKARKAGFNVLADILASAAKDIQIAKIMQVLGNEDGAASGDFDSITQRIEAVSRELAVHNNNDEEEILDDGKICTVCMVSPIEMVLMPCFHACLCTQCVPHFSGKNCPICRTQTQSSHRIFFP